MRRTEPFLLELPLRKLGRHVPGDVVHRPVEAETPLRTAPRQVTDAAPPNPSLCPVVTTPSARAPPGERTFQCCLRVQKSQKRRVQT